MSNVTISGGTKWQAYLERLAQKVQVRAGVMEGAKTDAGERVAEYAAYNEYGTSRIPPRPFMRKTLERERENWIQGVGALLGNGMSPGEALEETGKRMAEDIQKTIDAAIRNGIDDNADSTKLKKTKKVTGGKPGEKHTPGPLVDTAALLKSITHQVTK